MWKLIVATTLLFAISAFDVASVAFAADGAEVFDLSNTELTILNPDTREVLGHGHYKVTREGGAMRFDGENRFLDGEYDHEVQRVDLSSGDSPPVLVDYQHSFFNADGSPESTDAMDAKTGASSAPIFMAPMLRTSAARRSLSRATLTSGHRN